MSPSQCGVPIRALCAANLLRTTDSRTDKLADDLRTRLASKQLLSRPVEQGVHIGCHREGQLFAFAMHEHPPFVVQKF